MILAELLKLSYAVTDEAFAVIVVKAGNSLLIIDLCNLHISTFDLFITHALPMSPGAGAVCEQLPVVWSATGGRHVGRPQHRGRHAEPAAAEQSASHDEQSAARHRAAAAPEGRPDHAGGAGGSRPVAA